MTWTAPRTWVAGEVVTAAVMNTHVRDNLLELMGTDSAWTDYGSLVFQAGTNPTLSTNDCRYKQVGKIGFIQATVVASSTASAGIWTLADLPLNIKPLDVGTHVGSAAIRASGSYFVAFPHHQAADEIRFLLNAGTGSHQSAVAVGDAIYVDLAFEIA